MGVSIMVIFSCKSHFTSPPFLMYGFLPQVPLHITTAFQAKGKREGRPSTMDFCLPLFGQN